MIPGSETVTERPYISREGHIFFSQELRREVDGRANEAVPVFKSIDDVLVLAVGLNLLGFGLLCEFRFDSFDLFDELLIRLSLDELACAEVYDFEVVVVVQQQVLWLEIAVNNTTAPQELQDEHDFSGQKFSLMEVEFFFVIPGYCGA